MIRSILLLILALLFAGCADVPFKAPQDVSYEFLDPKTMVEQFAARTPENFQILNSVVFEFSWKSFMGIGYIDISRQNSLFSVVCLNPLGVQLFELSGDRDSVRTHSALPALLEYGDLPAAVGGDIRRIYYDLLPSSDALIFKKKNSIAFLQPSGKGRMEYIFKGSDKVLVEKNYYENNEIAWGISYYEYLEQDGKYLPQGIIFVNYKHGYQLTVRRKEL
jgi:hypothetical protein